MKKLPLCLTAAISFSLLNVATADVMNECDRKPVTEAAPFCKQACDLNYGVGCMNLGYIYQRGLGVRQDTQKAIMYYEKSCNLNIGGGCISIGELYEEGFGVKQDYQKALIYYKKACDLHDGACRHMARFYERGFGVKQDLHQAKEYYGKVCDGGNQQGCDEYRRLNLLGY